MAEPETSIFDRLPAVKARLGGIGTSTLYAMMARGEFPRPKRIGRNIVAWDRATVTAFLTERDEAAYRGPKETA
jgi:prophage regulatory protein